MWDAISSISTFAAVLVALFLPYWQNKYKLKIRIQEVEDKYSYIIENKSAHYVKITEIKHCLLQTDGLYSTHDWRSYNFYMKDIMSDDFGVTWNEEYKEKEYKKHLLQPRDGIIREFGKTSFLFMRNENKIKEIYPDGEKYGIIWTEVVIHKGKKFRSNLLISKITKNTEYDEMSENYNPPINDDYYEYDRFGNLVHEPTESSKLKEIESISKNNKGND